MTFAPVEIQKAIRARLISTAAVVAAVPAANILDAWTRTEAPAVIQIGEGNVLRENLTLARKHVRVLARIDVRTEKGGTAGAKIIAGEVYDALREPLTLANGLRVLDHEIERVDFKRDPGSERGQATIALSVVVEEPGA